MHSTRGFKSTQQIPPREKARSSWIHGSLLCDPSQNGIPAECLHAHHATVPASAISTFLGWNPVPLCDPSQNGWLAERPQAHHQ